MQVICVFVGRTCQKICFSTLQIYHISDFDIAGHVSFLQVKKQLTTCTTENDKETIHCEFDITGSDLTWTSGIFHSILVLSKMSQLPLYLNLYRTVFGPTGFLSGRYGPM